MQVVAADFANAVAERYIADQVAAKLAEIRRIGDTLESRAEALAADLERAESAVQAYRNELGLASHRNVQEQVAGEIDRALIEAEVNFNRAGSAAGSTP